MDYQATMNGPATTGRDLKEHVAGMVHDVAEIAELQAQLLAADLRKARAALVVTLVCWSLTLVLAISAISVGMTAFGWWLAETTELSIAGGLAVAAGGAAIVVVILAVVGWIQFRRQLTSFERSAKELQQNLRAMRAALSSRATPTEHPR